MLRLERPGYARRRTMNLSRKLTGQGPLLPSGRSGVGGGRKRSAGVMALRIGGTLAALALAACTGRSASPVGSTNHSLTASDVNRLLRQASFGSTPALVQDVISRGSFAAWIDNQYNLPASNYPGVCYPASACDPEPCTSFNLPNCQFEAVTTNPVHS